MPENILQNGREREMDTDVLGYDWDQPTCAETDLKFLDRLGKREWVCD